MDRPLRLSKRLLTAAQVLIFFVDGPMESDGPLQTSRAKRVRRSTGDCGPPESGEGRRSRRNVSVRADDSGPSHGHSRKSWERSTWKAGPRREVTTQVTGRFGIPAGSVEFRIVVRAELADIY